MTIPAWLRFLRNTGAIAVARHVEPPRRTLFGLPTDELAAAAVAVGAVAALASQRVARPLDVLSGVDAGRAVSAYHGGAYHDTVLAGAQPGVVCLAEGITTTTYADTVRRLPAGFPGDRPARRLRYDSATVAAWQDVAAGVDPARLHARCSATPVLVIGSGQRLVSDLDALDDTWPHAHAVLDPGVGLEEWLRHPVIVAAPRTAVPAWLPGCEAAAVVCDGAAAWQSPLRRAVPAAAHVLVLDRRSTAAIDLVEEIIAAKPTTEVFVPAPPPGVDAWRIGERDTTPVRAVDDEDLF